MDHFFIELLDDSSNKYRWVKIVLNSGYDDLSIKDITTFLNQYLISKYPSKIFFIFPNYLLKREDNTLYTTHSDASFIRSITSEEKETNEVLKYRSFPEMKKAMLDMIIKGDL